MFSFESYYGRRTRVYDDITYTVYFGFDCFPRRFNALSFVVYMCVLYTHTPYIYRRYDGFENKTNFPYRAYTNIYIYSLTRESLYARAI